jgi:hypothetical protein
MRRLSGRGLVALVVLLSLGFAVTAFADEALPVFKAGETVYVCACGSGCDCQTISRNDGKCTCDKPFAKTTVTKVEGGKLFAKVNGTEQAFSATAKYACACGKGCTCGTISQKAGNCSCGKAMKKI